MCKSAEIERPKAENFTLSAGQCIVVKGLSADEGGTSYCRLKAENERLRAEMQKIFVANPRNWEEMSEPEGHFERWAKSRIFHAIKADQDG